MGESRVGGVWLGGGNLGQGFQLGVPFFYFALHKGFCILLSANCCSKVGSAFMGDVNASARETGLSRRQVMFFGDEPRLGCIGKIAKCWAMGGEPIPPFAHAQSTYIQRSCRYN